MILEVLIEMARKSGFMGFCTGIRFDKIDGKRWSATLIDHDKDTTPHATGASIQEAAEAIKKRIIERLVNKATGAQKELAETREMLGVLDMDAAKKETQ